MQIPKIDSSRLYDPSSSSTSIQCVICHDIPLNPKECQNCQNLFCDDCINTWLEIKEVCPCFCSEEIFRSRQAHKFIRDLISNLKVKCLNYDSGCREILRFESLLNHEKNHCLFRKVNCPKGFCKEEVFIKDVETHKEKCVIEETECPGCKIRFLKNEFEKHECVTNLFKEVKSLGEKCIENDKAIKLLEQDITAFANENKKRTDFNSILEKLVKCRVKDLKLYMRSEVETVIQDILKNNPISDKVVLSNSQNDKKPTFTSKFFNTFKEQNPNESENSSEEKTKKNEEKESENSSDEEFKGSDDKQKKCHEKYENLTWMIDPEKLKCGRCSQIKLIRYKCRECRKNLCVSCKRPKFKKGLCPVGHELIKNKINSDAECDICSRNIMTGEICFSDVTCGADLCTFCHQ